MAITKTTKLRNVKIMFPRDVTDPEQSILEITIQRVWDDSEDDELPVATQTIDSLFTTDDVSSYPQFVQDLATWLRNYN